MNKYIELNDDKTPKTNFDTIVIDITKIDNAGILLNSNIVLVDFDGDNENEKRIIEHIQTKYPTLTVKTDRGVHLYYKRPKELKVSAGTDKITVGGFQVDYKTGNKAYGIVKRHGRERERNKAIIDFEMLTELPFILYPMPKAKNITGLKDGDGRNNALYAQLRCINNNPKYRDIRLLEPVAKFINEKIFDTPMGEKEVANIVNSVLKIDADAQEEYQGDPTNVLELSRWVARKFEVKLYKEILYFRDGIKFSRDENELRRRVYQKVQLKTTQWKELLSQLEVYAEKITHDDFNVRIRNGIIVDDTVVNMDIGFTPFYLDVKYDENAYDKYVDDFINFIANGDKEIRNLIEEILGHTIMINNFPHKIFVLSGSGNNGKSTFVEMLTAFANNLSSHIDITGFEDGTQVVSLIGKIINIADDIDPNYLEKTKVLKTMASGNTITARAIYSQPVTIKNTATLVFTCNEVPVFKDKTEGIKRRLIIIPFENKVVNKIYDLDKLLSSENAKSYILRLALDGVNRILTNHMELSKSKKVEDTLREYYIESDSVLGFLEEYEGEIDNTSTIELYNMYDFYCIQNNIKPQSKNKFTRLIKSKRF
jgi:phage/plasmid primase, P4 family, C-terminal domain|nr:MAG TPA: dsDNA helicase [Caudoviricetes sp.]